MENLDGEVAVVTGGASGNGRAIALELADRGADVVVADVRREPREGGTSTVEKIPAETDSQATHVDCDVGDSSRLAAAVDAADAYGGVTVMVNNAGVLSTGSFLDVDPESFDRDVAVNLRGVFFGCQHAARKMLDGDGGSIVNVSSLAGIRGMAGGATYCATKGGVRLLTYALADELGPKGVRVNAVHPGYVETQMFEADTPGAAENRETLADSIPLRRIGEADEVATAVAFLASDAASYVNGESLSVDGGLANTG
jgi:NAD(P)-dependent dehydrogenase (short-subunit alcohol dehydrogenase family)